jgi:uncharacterized membrane protein
MNLVAGRLLGYAVTRGRGIARKVDEVSKMCLGAAMLVAPGRHGDLLEDERIVKVLRHGSPPGHCYSSEPLDSWLTAQVQEQD